MITILIATFSFFQGGEEEHFKKTTASNEWYILVEKMLPITAIAVVELQFLISGDKSLIYGGKFFVWIPFQVTLAWKMS